ncbi:MAG: hypothetical protein PHQ08_03510 [Candidatus Pacebacteria bacterium]|nr:hypothetical protein [Candidatus Paceibacterota bacterium]
MVLIKIKCAFCKKDYFRPAGRINEAKKFNWNQFCSAKCHSKFKTKKQALKCENCNKKIIRTPHEISSHNYCSRSCAIIINNKKYGRKRLNPSYKICEQCKQKYKKSTNNKKFCSKECRKKSTRHNPGKLLKIIKDTAKRIKRTPGRREFKEGIDGVCIRIFGSWNKTISMAGLIPNRSYDNRMYKRARIKALNGHLCDSISEALIDNWLYKNKIIHSKNVSYPNTNHKADWATFLGEKKIFIEYFGLANDSLKYNYCIQEKEILCKKQNISLIAIYPKDLYPKVNMENNLKNKFREYSLI